MFVFIKQLKLKLIKLQRKLKSVVVKEVLAVCKCPVTLFLRNERNKLKNKNKMK